MIDRAACLAEVLQARAEREPDAVAYEIVDRTKRVTSLSHAQLAGRASALAGQLAGCGDGPVLLLYPAGIDYVVAIFAGFLAGVPVVPAYPPGESTLADRERLDGIITDARPSVVVAPDRHPDVPVPTTLAVPGPEADDISWHRPPADTDVALIQYTSGSTGRPRGVLVRHDSVAANTAAIVERFGLDSASRALSWLPPYHDMGLIGGILTPMAAGIPVRLMPPADFLKAPLSWLHQLTESNATVSGGPNFAYQLCLRRARGNDALAGLDLSSWRVAFTGAEPVKRRTMAEFAARFAPAGFRPEAFVPCYGLAEATLIVSAGRWSGRSATAGAAVSCGTPVPGQRVVVIDPEQGTECKDSQEGEIWIAGPHVTSGYWSGDPVELFGEFDGERFLRTGDLGYLQGRELFPTGRAKDVIVYRGANYHAEDVESAALDAVGTLGGAAAAFLVDTEPDPLPVLVLEVRGEVGERLATTVRAAVLAHTRLPLGIVALVPPRSVPRTSSGKVRRASCRDAFVSGAYDDAVVDDRAQLSALAEQRARSATAADLTAVICGITAGVCDAMDCCPTDSLLELGVDSVRAAEAAAILEDALGLDVPLDAVLTTPTPQGMADALLERWLADGVGATVVRDRVVAVANGEKAA